MAISDKKLKEIFNSVDRKVFFTLTQNFGDDMMKKVYEHVSNGADIIIEPVENEIDGVKVIAVSDEGRAEITE